MTASVSPLRIEELAAMRRYAASGATRSHTFRRDALRALKDAVTASEDALLDALHGDMRKPHFESYLAEIVQVHAELDHALRHLREWMRPARTPRSLLLWPARGRAAPEPVGVVLIIAPWNYPVTLSLTPLVAALAAGNCAVLKPSEEAPRTAAVLQRIVAQAFRKEHVHVVQGTGRDVVPPMMNAFRFDHVFFTGSMTVGRDLLTQAAPQLIPVTLELGGKSPAIVDSTANIEAAARRIAWSKFFNAGQTCIATDHALVHASVMSRFLEAFVRQTEAFYGKEPQRSPDFARMVNDRHYTRVTSYLADGRLVMGGQHDAAERYIAPTVLIDVSLDSAVMREEIFGPVLPVLPWREPDEVEAIIARNPTPLALYVFSNDSAVQRRFTQHIAFGGGCINHCMLHFGDTYLPFGGVGRSGMGSYHGKTGFDRFSHYKGIVKAGSVPEPGVHYPPYADWKLKLVRRV